MYYVQVELEYPSKNVRSIFIICHNLKRHISTTRRRVYLRFLLLTDITWHYSSSSSSGISS